MPGRGNAGPFGLSGRQQRGAGPKVITADAQLANNVSVSAVSYTDVLTIVLGPGIWDVWAWLTTIGGSGDKYAQISDAANNQLGQEVGNGGLYLTISVFAPAISLPDGATLKLRCYSDGATTVYGSTSLGAGGGAKIHAMLIG